MLNYLRCPSLVSWQHKVVWDNCLQYISHKDILRRGPYHFGSSMVILAPYDGFSIGPETLEFVRGVDRLSVLPMALEVQICI